MIKAIIFDLDGVLIDATEWHYEALNKALRLFGYRIGPEDHLTIYNGLPTYKKLEIMSKEQGLPEGLHKPIRRAKKEYTRQLIEQNCKPDYEKIIMLRNLSKRYQLICCSNAIRESVLHMLESAGISDYFAFIVGNDQIKNPKPDPEIFFVAMREMGLEPEECVIVEDAPHGVKAAKASGARVIVVKGYRDVGLSLFEREDLWS